MPVEKVFIENGVVIGEGFGESRQARCGYLFQRRFVRFVTDASAVENNAILGVHVEQRHHQICWTVFEGHRYDVTLVLNTSSSPGRSCAGARSTLDNRIRSPPGVYNNCVANCLSGPRYFGSAVSNEDTLLNVTVSFFLAALHQC